MLSEVCQQERFWCWGGGIYASQERLALYLRSSSLLWYRPTFQSSDVFEPADSDGNRAVVISHDNTTRFGAREQHT